MAYIRHTPPAAAGGRLAEVYQEIRGEVPRVPNLMQVFSLRPETMEAMYWTWLSVMWNGRVPRQTKEIVAVAVARAARSEYCRDSHMVFLQAAGMDGDHAFEVERDLAEAVCLDGPARAAVGFAARLTGDPRTVRAGDLVLLAKAWPDIEERVELLAAIAAENAITRVANALGVALEIPPPLRRFEATRRGAITMLSRLTSVSIDLGAKSVPAEPPDENRLALRQIFTEQLGFAGVPPGLEMLDACPEAFDGLLRLFRKSIAVVPRDRWMRTGLVVGRLTGCDYLSINCADWITQRGDEPSEVVAASEGVSVALPEAEKACLRFVRDFTLHSHTIEEERIRELRTLGLSDGAVLDLAFVAGIFNGMARLVIGLAPF